MINKLSRALGALSDSLAGDLIGALSLGVIFGAILFALP